MNPILGLAEPLRVMMIVGEVALIILSYPLLLIAQEEIKEWREREK